MEGDTTILEARTEDSPNPWSDDDDDAYLQTCILHEINIRLQKLTVTNV
jgi:hypothetical protein